MKTPIKVKLVKVVNNDTYFFQLLLLSSPVYCARCGSTDTKSGSSPAHLVLVVPFCDF